MDCKNNYTSIIEFKKSFDSDKGIKVCTNVNISNLIMVSIYVNYLMI